MSLYSMFAAAISSRTSSHRRVRSGTDHDQSKDPHLNEFHERVVSELREKLTRRDYGLSRRVCPTCNDRFLQIELDGVLLDYCPNCHGWWFDAAELMHFMESFEDLPDGDFVDRVSTLPCPVCAKFMREHQLQVNSNLMVHACPERHGIFLEDGEFERALEVTERLEHLAGHLNDQHLSNWREMQASLSAGDFISSELKCLECGDNDVIVSMDGVDIDYCTQCQSFWFDAKELRHFTKKTRDVPGDHLTSRETTHVCPKCRRYLRLYQFHSRSTVLIEACPFGHGVYLNSEQFARVLEASE